MFLIGAFLCVVSLNAASHSFATLEDGYRVDKTNNRVVLKGEGFGVRASSQSTSMLQSYQMGGVGKWAVTKCWFVQGAGHLGLIFDGQYAEAGFLGKANGTTADALSGIGYNIPIAPCFAIAPAIGWSYDLLNLTANHLTHPVDGVRIPVGNIKFKSTFNGPWGGLELLFQPNPLMDLWLEYQLHHADWNATRILTQGELGNPPYGTTAGFSNVRSNKHLWGNVFGIDALYRFCYGNIGLHLQYQAWQSTGYGTYKRTVTPLPPEITSSIVMNVEWESFSAMLQFGCTF